MLRYAVIGVGNMGSVHAAKLFGGAVDNAVLTAVCDIEEEKLARMKELFSDKVAYFSDYHKLLDSKEADAVIIATPHYLHPVIATEAFEKGWHVLTEKPAGVDAGSAAAMNEAAKKSGKAFGIMFNQRTNPLFSTLKYYLDLGVLGEIKRFVWIISNWYRTQSYYDSDGWRATWKGEGGGVLINQCPHNLDIWQWMMGMPETVHAVCIPGHFHRIDVEDDATIFAEYGNKATAVFITSTGEYPGTNRIEISGTMGKAVAENGQLKLWLLKRDERVIRDENPEAMPKEPVCEICIPFEEKGDGHIKILQNFTDHILSGKELIAPGEEGIKSLTISNAAYLSSWKNRTVGIPFDNSEFLEELAKQHDTHREKKANKEADPVSEYSDRWKVNW